RARVSMSQPDGRLANRILIGLLVGAAAGAATLVVGAFAPGALGVARSLATNVFDPLGQVFLRLLFFVVMPLVFASLATGVVQLGNLSRLGPLAGRTFALFFFNMAIAVALGMIMMNVIEPGNRLDPETQARLVEEFGGAAQQQIDRNAQAPSMTPGLIVDMFMPRNLLGSFVGNDRNALGEVLPLIVFAILVGAAGAALAPDKRARLESGLVLVTELMTTIVHFALRLAPFAVPAMIFSVVVKIGFDILVALGVFVVGCAACLLIHLFGTMSIWLRLWTRHRPLDFFREIK